jgi:25S rRNA (uracil2843-N3)-methyltransferase
MVKKTGPSRKAAPSKQSSSSKQSSKKSSAPLETSSPALQSEEQQQRLLNIFSSAFNNVLTSDDFSRLLQEIKQALFNREFAAAFGREDYLEAYAARWSPTRALCYAAVFLSIKKHLDGILIAKEETKDTTIITKEGSVSYTKIAGSTQDDANDKPEGTELEIFQDLKLDSTSTRRNAALRMLSVGGCAAEHVAFDNGHFSS